MIFLQKNNIKVNINIINETYNKLLCLHLHVIVIQELIEKSKKLLYSKKIYKKPFTPLKI